MGCWGMMVSIGLSGRREAFVQLELAIGDARLTGKRLLVALVNLDKFYRMNESVGMAFGDSVLNQIEKRLSTSFHAKGISRLEGNTFLVIVQTDAEDQKYWQAVEAVKYAVERPFTGEAGAEFHMTASIGVSVYPQDGRTSDQLICRSESALYQAKEHGGNRVYFYNNEDTVKRNRRLLIESSLRPALYLRLFELSYQPIYRLSDGRLKGFETLIRWEHPELGSVEPNEFIPIAEHNGLIVPIGEWVLREACKRLSMLRSYGMNELTISVNLSPVQLLDPTFAFFVLNTISEYQLPASAIELEMKEHPLIASPEALSALSKLRAAGVRISLDDFGTGYSSFDNLKQLPIHCLKIDRSFIGRIDLISAERHIVESLISLVKKLGLEVTAVGVEYEEQYDLLREWGCHYAQGYLLGQPMEAASIESQLLYVQHIRG
ncbi:bifunctional diguanylate cyclase/phosphodiesterase [Paenibacillus nanensis]|uniref:Bifunctional diguanylate cyclase/phosphodiesterase n=2 Tax=Paenibacillus nanensis TaxID=393251 RepID=A0A3A1VH50_9BACL|nr:bifunctional diguanylate cyclase/phosphodiesterase [Paenibacillus nanensis]